MKFLFNSVLLSTCFFLFSNALTGCSTNKDPKETPIKNSEIVNTQSNFSKLLSKNSSYTLHFKVEEKMNSPVRFYTYYITSTKDNMIVKKETGIAAEKIYWKNDHTLAIIPYVEVMQQTTEINENHQPNEILIDLNK